MRINKLMVLGVVLGAMMLTGISFAAEETKGAKPEAGAQQKEMLYKAVPKAQHDKMYPSQHQTEQGGMTPQRCYYSEKDNMYFCSY